MRSFFPVRRREAELDEAFGTLDAGMNEALARPTTLLDVERKKSDELMDEMRGRQIGLETQIAALTTELDHVRQVIKAETVRARVLFTDADYSPEADALGSHDDMLAAKKARGDKHFRMVRPPSVVRQAHHEGGVGAHHERAGAEA